MIKKIFGYTFIAILIGFSVWYFFVAIKPVVIPQDEIVKAYQYPLLKSETIEFYEMEPNSFKIAFNSFDGSMVNGQITFPHDGDAKFPVLVGVSPMGRNYNRWWLDSFKERPTLSNIHKLGEVALKNGYAVVAIDARYHGSRKDPNRTLRSIMNDLHYFGDKSTYEEMILDTVKDYRVLLDLLQNHEKVDHSNIVMAGYSMGGQISLLTASVDKRIKRVISIVPPYIDDKVALVAPKNTVSLIDSAQVLLLTSDNDEHASEADNLLLFDLIASQEKQQLIFKGNHILPADYVDSVRGWLVKSGAIKG